MLDFFQGSRFEANFALLREGAFSRLLLVDFCDRARVYGEQWPCEV